MRENDMGGIHKIMVIVYIYPIHKTSSRHFPSR